MQATQNKTKIAEKPHGVMRLQISLFSGGRMALQGSGNLTNEEIVYGLTNMINKIVSKMKSKGDIEEKNNVGVVPFNPRRVDQVN